MAKKLIDVQANGFKSYVDATAAAVGAEPALGNPGPGTWFLKTISGVRSWVASIPWAGVDKTGAVASDVGALPAVDPIITGTPKIDNGSGNLSRMRFNAGANRWTLGISSSSEGGDDTGSPFMLAAYTDAGELIDTPIFFERKASSPITVFRSLVLLPLVGTGTRPAAIDSTGKLVSTTLATIGALPIANPTATGTLTAPDVVVSNLAGTGTRAVAADSTGKLVASSRGFLWSDAAKDFNASSSNLSMLSATSAQRKIAANTWVPGKVLQFKIQSIISSASPPSTSSTFKFMMGPDGTFTSPYYTIVNIVRSLAAGQWSISSVITLRCVTTGTSGSFYYTVDTIISNATGSTMHHDVLSSYTGYTGNTIDTTIDRWIDFTEDGVYTDIYGVSSSAEWIA